MSVGIVIPAWNLWKEMTFPCLKSIRMHTDIERVHIYLVDNGSTDETAVFAKKIGEGLFGSRHFTLIRNEENKGFAIASNQGAEAACADGCEFVLFLNNDTLVTENWLPPLIKALDDPKIGLAGPLLLYPDNTVQHCGVVRDFNGFLIHIYSGHLRSHPRIRERCFKVLTGAALMVRTREFIRLGKFYEEYQNGFEDVDLGYTYFHSGFMGKMVPESVVYHLESKTPGRKNVEMTWRNNKILDARNVMAEPDAHLYYEEDGLVQALSDEFIFYPRISEEKRSAFNRKIMTDYSDALCWQMLKEEPYWYDGYYLLIESMLSQKFYEEAKECCSRISKIFHHEEVCRTYLRCFEMAGDETKLKEAQEDVMYERGVIAYNSKKNKEFFEKHIAGTRWEEKLLSAKMIQPIDFSLLEKFKKSLGNQHGRI